MAATELRSKLHHGHLPSQAQEPDKNKNQRHSIHLMVNQLVVLVNLEDESVVDVVAAEDLYRKTSREEDEAQNCREIVAVHPCIYFVPIRLFLWWTRDKENKEAEKNKQTTAEETDQVGVFAPHFIVLSVKLCLCLSQISLAEAISIEGE